MHHRHHHQTLEAIREELKEPFRDRRQPYNPPTSEKLFYMLTGEEPDKFMNGSIVDVVYSHATARTGSMSCKLANGLQGLIRKEDIDEDLAPEELETAAQRFEPGQTLRCVVQRIDHKRYQVFLDHKQSKIEEAKESLHDKGSILHRLEAAYISEGRARGRHGRRKGRSEPGTVASRTTAGAGPRKGQLLGADLDHPFWHRVTREGAEQLLQDGTRAPDENCIFRPSATNAHHGNFSLTMLMRPGSEWFQHVNLQKVVEKDKTDPTAMPTESWVLTVPGSSSRQARIHYEDLDEILNRYVAPITELARRL
eukprot:gene3535-3986_t